jgi:protoheme IX farnesyltransferase
MSTTAEIARVAFPWRALVETTKPRLSMLVLFTVYVGFAASTAGRGDTWLLIHAMVGTALVAGGANAFNQVMERDLDALMERTRNRPLPSGRVGAYEVAAFAAVVSFVGLLELLLFVNPLTAMLGAAALGLYVLVYTPLKQSTPLNTLVGAVVGAIPPLMGWTAARGTCDIGGWALFAILFVWQLPHFLSIARLYRDDYARGGFRMLSVVDETGERTRRQVFLMAVLLVPVSLLPVMAGVTGRAYGITAVVLGLLFVASCRWGEAERQEGDARRSFIASIIYLPCLLGMLRANGA